MSAPASGPAPTVPDRKRPYSARPRFVPIGLGLMLLSVPFTIWLAIVTGLYVPDIGYVDPGVVLAGAAGIFVIGIGWGFLYYARTPVGYPRPPFASVNPPSMYAPTGPGGVYPSPIRDGVPPLYWVGDSPIGGSLPPARGAALPSFDSMGISIRSTRCPRCGWTGTVALLNCPRCGLRL